MLQFTTERARKVLRRTSSSKVCLDEETVSPVSGQRIHLLSSRMTPSFAEDEEKAFEFDQHPTLSSLPNFSNISQISNLSNLSNNDNDDASSASCSRSASPLSPVIAASGDNEQNAVLAMTEAKIYKLEDKKDALQSVQNLESRSESFEELLLQLRPNLPICELSDLLQEFGIEGTQLSGVHEECSRLLCDLMQKSLEQVSQSALLSHVSSITPLWSSGAFGTCRVRLDLSYKKFICDARGRDNSRESEVKKQKFVSAIKREFVENVFGLSKDWKEWLECIDICHIRQGSIWFVVKVSALMIVKHAQIFGIHDWHDMKLGRVSSNQVDQIVPPKGIKGVKGVKGNKGNKANKMKRGLKQVIADMKLVTKDFDVTRWSYPNFAKKDRTSQSVQLNAKDEKDGKDGKDGNEKQKMLEAELVQRMHMGSKCLFVKFVVTQGG